VDFCCELTDGAALRPVQESDAGALSAAFQANRAYLSKREPIRPEEFYTTEGQLAVIRSRRAEMEAGTALPMVLAKGGTILGLLNLSSIVRGAFQNAHIGYWIDQAAQSKGLMTAAVGSAAVLARDALGLHRLEAATLILNAASQRVLEKNGFEA
jgi:ribosomal-protein-alanine N-acetyltransferase